MLRLEGMHQLCFCSWLVLAAAGPFGHFEGCLYFFGLEFAQPTLLEHIMVGRGLVWARSSFISTSSTYAADELGALQDSSLHWMVGRIYSGLLGRPHLSQGISLANPHSSTPSLAMGLV